MARPLLHDTVKELHGLLQLPSSTPINEFDTLLRRAVHNVFVLLGLSARDPHRLDISTSVFEEFSLVYYTRSGSSVDNVSFNDDNIYLFLRDDTVQASSSLYDQLLSILAEPHDRLVRLKEDYSSIVSQLSELVQFFLKLNRSTTNDLLDLVLRCFSYEFSYFQRLNSEMGDKNENGNQRIILALDSFIRRNKSEESLEADLIFTHDLSIPTSYETSLGFECLDASFEKLYHTFFQLALYKSLNSFYEDSLAYVKVMIEFFKNSYGIDHFERDTQANRDLIVAKLCLFFLGSHGYDEQLFRPLVPLKFQHLARNIIEELYESLKVQQISNGVAKLNISNGPELGPISVQFLQADLVDLVSNLKTVVSVFNEYDLGFDSKFSTVFRDYLHMVYEVNNEQASMEDYLFIGNVKQVVDKIIDFVGHGKEIENDIIQDVVSRLHGMESRLLLAGSDLTLLMRAAYQLFEAKTNLARRVLTEWSHRLLEVIQLETIKSDELGSRIGNAQRKKFLSIWYNKFVRNQKILSQAASFSDKRTISHYLTTYWLKKIIFIARANDQAEWQSLKPIFAIWKARYQLLRKNFDAVAARSDLKVEKKYFDSWMLNHNHVGDLNSTAEQFRNEKSEIQDRKLQSEAFHLLWKKFSASSLQNDQTLTKLASLGRLEKDFQARKVIDLWKHKVEIANVYNSLKMAEKNKSLSKGFQLWKRKHNLKQTGMKLEHKRNRALLVFILARWNMVTLDRSKSDDLYDANLLNKTFKVWKLSLAKSRLQSDANEHQLFLFFKKWKLKSHYLAVAEKTDQRLKHNALVAWKEKAKAIESNVIASVELSSLNLKQKAMRLWQSKLQLMSELAQIADLNFQRKYLQRLISAGLKFRELNEIAESKLAGNFSLADKVLLQAVMVKWSTGYMQKFDNHSEQAIQSFEQLVRTPNFTAVFFKHWKQRKNQKAQAQLQLENRLEQYSRTSTARRPFLEAWIDKLQEVYDNEQKGTEFYLTLLHKRFLLVWYEKYATNVEYLNDVAQQMIDRKDYLKLVDHLRKWNLRYIKNVQRNQQTCEIFAKKWEKAHLRSMFELWAHKARHKNDKPDEMHEIAEANTTFGSSYSPLAKKSRGASSGSSLLDDQNYLSTPVKKQAARNFMTPFSKNKGPSPTRLQETNQRMKFDRMDALTTRYRLAKDGASRSAILKSTSATRLPPPRSNVTIPERPPAPMFDVPRSVSPVLSREISPNATSSPTFTPRVMRKSASPILDQTILSTAKKLRKIRPLIVPPAEDEQDFQYTSASELKERLHSPTRADIFRAI